MSARVARIADGFDDDPDLVRALDAAALTLRGLAVPRRQHAGALRLLLDAIGRAFQIPEAAEEIAPPAPVSAALALRWMTHADGLAESAAGFRSAAEELSDDRWAERLNAYVAALEAATELVPRKDLEPMARASRPSRRGVASGVSIEQYEAAGFGTAPNAPAELIAVIDQLQVQVERHADALDELAAELERHPVRAFATQRQRVLRALSRFELARHLRRRGPIARASQGVLGELLPDGRLYPVVRELVAAMVRFEWYFEPLRMTAEGREVILGDWRRRVKTSTHGYC